MTVALCIFRPPKSMLRSEVRFTRTAARRRRLTRVYQDTTGCPEHGSSCNGPASLASPSRPERDPWAGNSDWRHGSAGDAYLRAGISLTNASSPPPTHFCSESVINRPPKTACVQRSGSPVKPNSPTLARTRTRHRSGPSWTSLDLTLSPLKRRHGGGNKVSP